jgi:hypothetical protein
VPLPDKLNSRVFSCFKNYRGVRQGVIWIFVDGAVELS